jgi:hypothetical protein
MSGAVPHLDMSASELRQAAALAMVLEGAARTEAKTGHYLFAAVCPALVALPERLRSITR